MTVQKLIRRIQIAGVILDMLKREPEGWRQFQSVGAAWGMIRERCPYFINMEDVVDALKFLWRNGHVRLTKSDFYYRRDAWEYTGLEADDFFYYGFPFNVTVR